MRTTPHRMRAHAGVCPRVRTLALSMLASRASSASVPTEASVDAAVHGACARGLLGPAKSVDDYPLGFFYDLDAFEANMASLRHAFPPFAGVSSSCIGATRGAVSLHAGPSPSAPTLRWSLSSIIPRASDATP